MHDHCTGGCTTADGRPLRLVHYTSRVKGLCITCRGLDTKAWYAEYLADKAERLVDGPARRAKALRLRVYGKAGRPTRTESEAEARGKAVGAC